MGMILPNDLFSKGKVMSYRCQVCRTVVPPRISLIRKVVETRTVEYKNVEGKVIGTGTETVRELHLCPKCANPEQVKETTSPRKYTRKAASVKPVKVEKPLELVEGKPTRQRRRKKEAA